MPSVAVAAGWTCPNNPTAPAPAPAVYSCFVAQTMPGKTILMPAAS